MWLRKEKLQTEALCNPKGKGKNSMCLEGKKGPELVVLKAISSLWDAAVFHPAPRQLWPGLSVSWICGQRENSPSRFSSEARKVDCFPAMKFPIEELNASFLCLWMGRPGSRTCWFQLPAQRGWVLQSVRDWYLFICAWKDKTFLIFVFFFFFFLNVCNVFKAGGQPAKLPLICSHINILCQNMCLITSS